MKNYTATEYSTKTVILKNEHSMRYNFIGIKNITLVLVLTLGARKLIKKNFNPISKLIFITILLASL